MVWAARVARLRRLSSAEASEYADQEAYREHERDWYVRMGSEQKDEQS